MITIDSVKSTKILALILGLAFVFAPRMQLMAITAADCDPWPTEDAKILDCVDYYIQNPQARTYVAGTDPANPVSIPFVGLGGLGVAYTSKIDKILVVSSETVSGRSRIMGILADPKTLITTGQVFAIDQSISMYRGSPKVLYNAFDDKFFVAWEDARPSGESRSTYARIISGSGIPEGKEIVVSSGVGFLNDIAYDSVNHKYIVMFEPGFPVIKTVDASGNVDGRSITVAHTPNVYEGQGNLTYNPDLNEYWVVYATATGGGASEDDRVVFVRIDATSGLKIGEPSQLSQTRLGHNTMGSPKIEYDPLSHAAVVVWGEQGRDGISGVWGRSINTDGSLGAEFPVLTQTTFPYSEGYGVGTLSFNPYSGTFIISAIDWNGGAESVEVDSSGVVYNQDQVIAPPCGKSNCGTFNLVGAPAGTNNVFLGSLNYSKVGGTSQVALGTLPAIVPAPNPPITPGVINIGSIGIAVNQIYIWSLAAASLLALLMIIIGGYITLTAAGNAERASRGKTYITSSITGLVLLFGAYLLLNTINPDLVNFRNPVTTIQTK